MEQRPDPPPEGRLIADAAARMNLSIREAARRAGISYGRWRQITQGYQNVSPGSFAPVHAPAKTVAKMAAVVGVTPEQMEAEGERPDAAEIMRLAAAPEPRRDRPLRALEDADEEGLRPYVQSALAEVYAAVGLPFPPGRDLPDLADVPELAGVIGAMAGETLFADPADQAAWEVRELSAPERIRLIARFRRLRDESEGTSRNALLTARPP